MNWSSGPTAVHSLSALWLTLLWCGGCQRITEFCENDSQCPSGWICGAADRCIPAPDGDGGNSGDGGSGGDGGFGDSATSRPASCSEIRAANPLAGDGSYTLYVNHDSARPWTALCNGMGGEAPAEYLTLLRGSSNFSELGPGVNAGGTTVHTTYWSLRLDPITLRVNANDQQYASSNAGSIRVQNVAITSMPYGVAAGCDLANANGKAGINLIGTPFIVASTFARGVSGSVGQSTFSQGGKVVALTGGGGVTGGNPPCGWVAESTGSANLSLAQNPPLGPTIQLAYE